jgi:ABC-type uncharacterized transport system YnjBCD ATPase subunit
VLLFDLLPVWSFLALALAGTLAGFGLRVRLHAAALRRDGLKQTRRDRIEFLVGTLSQSAAIGLALTLVADLLFVAWITDARLLAGLTVLIAALTSFGAAFVREVIRRLFYK